jgi:hypothetical protein
MRDDLYEQCSLHITEYIANSRSFGVRPRMPTMRSSSLSVNPKERWRRSSAVSPSDGGGTSTDETVA